MMNAYAYFTDKRFEVLGEFLRTRATHDQGVLDAYGTENWMSNGFFVEAAARIYEWDSHVLYWFAGAEDTIVRGDGAGSGDEELYNIKTGPSLKLNEYLTLKIEYSHLKYSVPTRRTGVLETIGADRDSVSVGVAVSY